MKSKKYEIDFHFQNKMVNDFLMLHSRTCTHASNLHVEVAQNKKTEDEQTSAQRKRKIIFIVNEL